MEKEAVTGKNQVLRWSIFLSGAGMIASSFLTIRHFFLANFPETVFQGSFCDISTFLNCDSSAYSSIAHFWGVPLGYLGLVVGILVCLGAAFPSPSFERTISFLAFWNGLGVLGLFLYSVAFLKSLCLLCTGYYVFSLLSLALLWKAGQRSQETFSRFARPSFALLVAMAVLTLSGAFGFHLFYEAKREAQIGRAMKVVKEFYELPLVNYPSFLSPCWVVRSTERFEDAPIQVVEYGDFLCPDCHFLAQQLERLRQEFAGKINIVFQFFPLEAKCNDVVDKNRHPGACELSYIAAHAPQKFPQIHDEIFANFAAAHNPEWRRELARKYGVEEALTDPETQALVRRIIQTGKEYEKTSDRYPYGIRSTPTMIINNRMIIGTLPYDHLRAIFQALVEERETGSRRFLENWVPLK